MKSSRSDVHGKFHGLPQLRFEDQQLTSFSGLIVVQELFGLLDLKARLSGCFRHLPVTPIFGHAKIVLLFGGKDSLGDWRRVEVASPADGHFLLEPNCWQDTRPVSAGRSWAKLRSSIEYRSAAIYQIISNPAPV